MYYIYILRCEDNSLYTGITTDVHRRFKEHTADKVKGAKYTKAHRPIKIEAVWETDTKANALRIECYIKKLAKSEKEELISGSKSIDELILTIGEINVKRVNL